MIYTDGIHIASESLAELHRWCRQAGIKRCWYHPHREHPHYDKPKRYEVVCLIDKGAEFKHSRFVLEIAKRSAIGSRASTHMSVKSRAIRGLAGKKNEDVSWLKRSRHAQST